MAEKSAGGTRRYALSLLQKFKGEQANNVGITDAAQHLGVSVPTLRRWDKNGKLTPERNSSGERLYSKAHLESIKPGSPGEIAQSKPITMAVGEQIPANKYENLAAIKADADPEVKEVRDMAQSYFPNSTDLLPTSYSAAQQYLRPVGGVPVGNGLTGVNAGQMNDAGFVPDASEHLAFLHWRRSGKTLIISVLIAFLLITGTLAALPVGMFLNNQFPDEAGIARREAELVRSQTGSAGSDIALEGIVGTSAAELIINADTVINGTLTARGLTITGESQLNVTTNSNIDQDLSTTSSPTFASINLSNTTNQITSGDYVLSIGGSGTIVTTDATQTLTNKTIDGGSNTLKNIPNSALSNSKITINTSGLLTGGGEVALGQSITLNVESGISTSSASCVTTEDGIVTGAAICPTLSSVSGTANSLAKFASATSLGDSSIFDDGTNVTFAGGKLNIDASGNITKINNVTYSFPSSQGGADSTLINDGAGALTWASTGGSGTIGYWSRSAGVLSPANSSDILEVNAFRLPTGASNNYVLTTDGSGNASWTNPNGGSFGAWTLNGNVIFANASNYQLLLGSTTASDAVGRETVVGGQAGKAAFVVNETGDQNIFVASSSGVTKFYIGSNGNVNLSGTNMALNGGYISGDGDSEGMTVDSTGLVGFNLTTFNPVAAPGVTTDKLYNLSGSGLTWAGNAVCNASGNCNGTGSNLGGSGATNYVARWSDTYNLTTGLLWDSGTQFGFNTVAPLALFDIRGTQGTNALSGTIPVASISGLTSMAALVVDNNGVGDLFTASKSGATKFVITNSGNVGIGTSNPGSARFSVASGNVGIGTTVPSDVFNVETRNGVGDRAYLKFGEASVSKGALTLGWTEGDAGKRPILNLRSESIVYPYGFVIESVGSSTNLMFNPSGGRVSIGTNNPLSTFDVRRTNGTISIASFSGATAFAGLVVDNSGVGDIFTASSSGLSRFVITQTGNVGIGSTAPRAPLQVQGATNSYPIMVSYPSGGSNQYSGIAFTRADVFRNVAEIKVVNDSTGYGNLAFLLDNQGNGSDEVMRLLRDVNGRHLSLGTSTPLSLLYVSGSIKGKASTIIDETGDQDLFSASASGTTRFTLGRTGTLNLINSDTTANATTITANGLSTGNLMSLTSTSIALSTGKLLNIDFSPGGATTYTGNLVNINVGGMATISGQIFNIQNNGSDLFSVNQTTVNSNLPVSFNAPGDVAIAYDINFTNTTASFIKSSASLYLTAGKIFNSDDLGLQTYNKGNVIIDSEALSVTRAATVSGQLVLGTSTAPANIGNLYLTNSATFGKALAILNQTEGADIFTASNSGTTRFTISASGNVNISGLTASSAVYTDANKNLTTTAPSSGVLDYWQRTTGSLAPTYITDSINIGAVATSSALVHLAGTAAENSFFNTGNVGIGSITPGFKLDVNGTGRFSTAVNTAAINTDGNSFNMGINSNIDGYAGTLNLSSYGGGAVIQTFAGGSGNDISLKAQTTGLLHFFTNGSERLTIGNGGNVGIGTTAPTAQFNQVFAGATTNGAVVTGNGLSTGNLMNLTSTSIALATGKLLNIDFSPGGATTYTGNLVNINVGGMATISGQIFNIQNNGSDLFSVNQAVVTSNLPVNFISPGDVGIAYDLSFTNPVSSYITSNAPLSIVAGKIYNSSNLTLSTYNVGNVIVDSQAFVTNYAATVSGQLVVGTTTPTPGMFGKFYVEDSQNSTASAFINNTNSAGGTILALKTGDTTPNGSYFLTLLDGSGNTIGAAKATSDTVATWQSGGIDLAEYFVVDSGLSPSDFSAGQLVCQGTNGVKPCGVVDDQVIIGAISTAPAFLGGIEGPNKVIVGLLGQIPVKVAADSAGISAGDFLTVSGSGRAKKAESSGFVVGKALASLSSPNGNDTVMVLIQPGWADVNNEIATAVNDLTVSNSISSLQGWANLSTMSAEIATITETLKVVGHTDLGNTNIAGHLTVGLLSFDEILGDLSSVNGEVSLQHGSVKVRENGEVSGTATIRGSITLATGSSATVSVQTWSTAPASIIVTPSWNTKVWITNLSATGFTVNVDLAPTTNQKLYWQALW